MNPTLLKIMERRDVDVRLAIDAIIADGGSVRGVDWLSDEEKLVFLTFFEIDQYAIIRKASARQRWICQAQSINLAFAADEDEAVISGVHKMAFQDKRIKSLYYIRSEAGVVGSTGECVACEG